MPPVALPSVLALGNMVVTGAGASADFTLDADLISIDAVGTSNITVTGSAGEDFTISQAAAGADASLFITSSGTGTDALQITTTGASGDMIIDSTDGTLIVDAGEAVAGALTLRATGGTTATAVLTSNGTGLAAVNITTTGAGGDITLDSNDAINLPDFDACTLTTVAGVLTCGTDAGAAWNTIGDATGPGAILMGETVQTLDWNMATDIALDALTITLLNDAGGTGAQNLLTLTNSDNAAAVGVTESLLVLNNLDTTEAVTAALKIISAAGAITTAIDVSDPDIVTAIDIGANLIAGTSFSVATTGAVTAVGVNSGSGLIQGSGGLTISGGDIALTDNSGTTWSVTNAGVANFGVSVTIAGSADGTDALILTLGDILVTNGDLDLSGGDFNVILDAADGVNISKGAAPTVDVFTIAAGSPATDGVDALALTLTATNQADFTNSLINGQLTAQGTAATDIANGILLNLVSEAGGTETGLKLTGAWDTGIDATDANIGNAISVGVNTILGTTGDINFTNFDVTGSTGNITVAAGQGITTNAAGAFNLGTATATSVALGSASATTITLVTDNNAANDFSFTGGTTMTSAAAVTALTVTSAATATADAAQITLTSTGDTAGIDALSITGTASDQTNRTVSLINGSLTSSGTGAGDIANGILMNLVSSAGGTESGLKLTGVWDNAIDASDSNIVNALIAGANDLSGTSWSITGSTGAAVFVGVNSGSGLIQGSGGLTISGGDIALTDNSGTTWSVTNAGVANFGASVTIAGTGDGTDALILTLGDILVTNGDLDLSGGDFNVILDAADGVNISKGAAPTVDVFTIAAGSPATDGVDALALTLTATNQADFTNSLINGQLTAQGTAATDIANGILLNLVSQAGGTETGLKLTGAWDTGIDATDANIVDALSVGVNNIVGTTGDINFTNFDVTGSTGNITVAAGQGITTNAAGALNLGTATATSLALGSASATAITLVTDNNAANDFSFTGGTTFTAGAAVTNLTVTSAATATADAAQITLTSTGDTAGIDALSITGTASDQTNRTVSLINGSLTSSGTGAGDIANGILMNLVSSAGGTESGLKLTGVWDNAIDASDSNIVNALIAGANDLSGTSWSITGSTGAAVFVGVNSGSGLIQGSGGLTISGGDIALTDNSGTTWSVTNAGVANFGASVTIAGSGDGTDALILTLGDILVTNGDLDLSGGDFNVILDAADGVNISKGAAPTVDVFTIAAGSPATDGVDALALTLTATNQADFTNSLINGQLTAQGTAATDIANGILLNLVSQAGGTETGLKLTGAWDTGIDATDANIVDALSVGVNNIVGTTGDINFTNFDVTGSTGNITVAAGQGITTNAAGALNLGTATATSLALGSASATAITLVTDNNAANDFSFTGGTTFTAGAAVTNLTVTSAATATADAAQITLTSTGDTAGIDALSITGTASDQTNRTVSLINGSLTSSGTGAGDIANGILMNLVSSAGGTESGLKLTGVWDNAIDASDSNIVNALIAGANDLSGTSWSITGSTGAAVFVGVNSGSGLIQGSGGLTISGGDIALTDNSGTTWSVTNAGVANFGASVTIAGSGDGTDASFSP